MSSPKRNPTNLESVKKCEACPGLGIDHVPSEGSRGSFVMIIGQDPGPAEARAGRPFIGPSGELVNYMLDTAGLDREEVYIANAVKCHTPNNRGPHPEELHTCYNKWLKWEIHMVDPKLVLVLGKKAYTSVIQDRHPFMHLGTIASKQRVYMMAYHPSYMLRQGRMDEFVSSVGQALRAQIDKIARSLQ